jgi:outer membrane protein
MTKRFFQKLVFPALLFISAKVHSQDTTLPHLPAQWTLQDCVDFAKKNNIQVRTLKWSELSGKEDLLQAKAARLPFVSGSVSENLLNGRATDGSGNFHDVANLSSNYSVNSSVTLYNGGYLKTDIKAKDLLLQSAGLDVKEAENDIALSVTQAYLNILLARENITYIEDVLTTSQVQLKLGQQRYDTGAISRKDLVQLEAQVASDQYTLVTAQNNYRLNVVILKQTLQLPSPYEMKIVVPDTVIVQKIVRSLPDAQMAARELRPEIKNGELGIQIAQTTLQKAEALVKPEITAGGSLSTGTSTNQDPHYFSQVGNNFNQGLGVSMSIPIFSRRVNKTAINKSKIQIEQAKLSLLNTKTILDQQVEQAYINLQSAEAQYDAATVQMKANEEVYKISNDQFRLGAINSLELQQQRNLYIQALQSFIQAKYNAVLNYKIVDYYTGEPISL